MLRGVGAQPGRLAIRCAPHNGPPHPASRLSPRPVCHDTARRPRGAGPGDRAVRQPLGDRLVDAGVVPEQLVSAGVEGRPEVLSVAADVEAMQSPLCALSAAAADAAASSASAVLSASPASAHGRLDVLPSATTLRESTILAPLRFVRPP